MKIRSGGEGEDEWRGGGRKEADERNGSDQGKKKKIIEEIASVSRSCERYNEKET